MDDMTTNENFPKEILHIRHFLSLNEIELEIKPFTIITGDMAYGKSLLIKILELFETIHKNLFVPLPKSLEIDKFYNRMVEAFDLRFHLDDTELFDIDYKFIFSENTLDIRIFRDKNNKEIVVKSNFLEKELPEWNKYLEESNKKRLEQNLKTQQKKEEFIFYNEMEDRLALYNRLSSKLGGHYPISATFVPATRAALAVSKMNFSKPKENYYDFSEYYDYYLNEFNSLVKFLKPIKNSKYKEEVNKILKAEMKINGDISFKHIDGRSVDIVKASSGQQEMSYVLLLLSRLFSFRYNNAKQHYVFIEEPEAHLFPLGQKLVLELICKIFNDSFDSETLPIKFFITTHSPYVLNTVNNALIKGNIKEKFSDKYAEISNDEKIKDIPVLDYRKVSTIFINDKGGIDDILEEYDGDYMINPKKINDISKDIMDEYNFLNNFKNKLLNDRLSSNS